MVIVITAGAHRRNVHMPELTDEPRQFAHRFDPDEAEDVPHQCQNFLSYATALGGNVGPHILLGPDDIVSRCFMRDWAQIVSTATGVRVETR